MNDPAISVVGLGKLGAPVAACFARKSSRVVGIDTDPSTNERINLGLAPVFEPGLDQLIKENRQRLSATDDYAEAILRTDITFVIVPTPSDHDGGFSIEYVLSACERIGEALRAKDGYHLVVLTSTVLPGVTDDKITPLLERTSNRRCGEGFGLCYSPEFIALGSVIHDFLNPDFLLIGESDTRAGDLLEALFEKTCENSPLVARMSFVEAELTKIALNSFVTMKITFANTLARICERLPGASVDVVTSALGHDTRIGGKYLKGATSYGGPCFPRDNIAFSFLASRLGVPCQLAEATDKVNRMQVEYLFELIRSELPRGGVVGVLGLSYKPDTCVVDESPGLLLVRMLLANGFSVCSYDPMGMDNARRELGADDVFAASSMECAQRSDVVVVATPWKEFGEIPVEAFVRDVNPKVVIDCWRILDEVKYGPVVRYIGLGNWMGK
jgi:UDPglucose 6-dehydrogenase